MYEVILRYKKILIIALGVEITLSFGAFLYIKKYQTNQAPNTFCASSQESFLHADISGGVENPGVYELPFDSRVKDLIEASGGLRKDASVVWVIKNLNFSQKLIDEQKIYIPFDYEITLDEDLKIIPLVFESTLKTSTTTEVKQTSSSSSNKVNVNTCDLATLDSLAGIGATYAQKIIDNRPYADLADLISNSGVSKSTLEKISDQLAFN